MPVAPRLAIAALVLATTVGAARAAAEGRPLVPAATDVEAAEPARSRSMGDEAVRTAVALAAVLSLVLVVRHLVRRRGGGVGPGAATGLVETLGRTPVGRGRAVVLLRVGPRILCLHEGPQEMRTLCEFTDPREVEPLLAALARGDAPIETVDLTRREPRPGVKA